jgi:NAD(P)-dependent dehydrogenase (short-subunit alcohol dehydrogenase family)
MDTGLKGARVIVTAGASGIGLATARAFVAEGARVEVCDVDGAALAQLGTSDAAIHATHCDVADREALPRWFAAAIGRLAGLDVLVNNAGIAGPTARCEDVKLADWDRTLAINLSSMFQASQLAIPHLRKSANPSMANLSSAAGRFGYGLRTPYAASKWAVIGLSKSLAIELGADGVRVNAICPGPVAGPRIDRVIADKARSRGQPIDETRAEYLKKTSLGRFVTAEDIANTIVFLASKAGMNISGQAIAVDGDTQSLA